MDWRLFILFWFGIIALGNLVTVVAELYRRNNCKNDVKAEIVDIQKISTKSGPVYKYTYRFKHDEMILTLEGNKRFKKDEMEHKVGDNDYIKVDDNYNICYDGKRDIASNIGVVVTFSIIIILFIFGVR